MERSSEIKNLTFALLNFQREVSPIFRGQEAKIQTKSGGMMRYRFADLAEIQAVISEPLLKNGLIIIQCPIGKYCLETTLLHESGEFISSQYEMIPAGNNPQSQGSTITYQKRYAIVAMLNLQVTDDDDAAKVSERTSEEKQASKAFLKSSKELEKDMSNDEFFSRLYRAERALIQSRGSFSLREFLGQHYEYTTGVIAKIEDEYYEYKVKKSLP